jgi:hypothetical protein
MTRTSTTSNEVLYKVFLIGHLEGKVSIIYFLLSTLLGSTITESSCLKKKCKSTNDNKALLSRRIQYKLFHTLHSFGIETADGPTD